MTLQTLLSPVRRRNAGRADYETKTSISKTENNPSPHPQPSQPNGLQRTGKCVGIFPGQGHCPCRGPAVRRRSCGARNQNKHQQNREHSIPAPSAIPAKQPAKDGKMRRHFPGSRTLSLSRSSGETLVVRSTKPSPAHPPSFSHSRLSPLPLKRIEL